MSGYSVDIERKALENDYFRQVLYTASHSQLVVMMLQAGEDIGQERHDDVDQFIRIEAGQGEAILDGERHALSDGSAVIIPAGTTHNVINTSPDRAMHLYTIYSPPNHPDGTIHRTRQEAIEAEGHHHG